MNPREPLRWEISGTTVEPTHFGSGWLSGLLSALLGIVGMGLILCAKFPAILTIPHLHPVYRAIDFGSLFTRAVLHLILVAAFLLGIVSLTLRRNKLLGLVGITCTVLAAVLGGTTDLRQVSTTDSGVLGLDWFLLNMLLYSAIYVPLERFFALHPEQPTFRPQWRVDLTYFFFNTLLIQFTTLLTLQPAMVLFDWARIPRVEQAISGLPLIVQVLAALLIADFAQYWVHRAFHVVPLLWRFHAIHHSTEAMDWLAGSRLHLVDAVTTRALTYIPLYVLGFSRSALAIYVVIVVIQATFIHANVRWKFRWIQPYVATPCFHHWHHASEKAAIDRNFAVHTPIWDRLFGTLYLPDRWPSAYGLHDGTKMPASWLKQLLYPLQIRPAPSGNSSVTAEDPARGLEPP